ncbi:unnamed protein product [Vicia faba]|uniref:Uncharacterized protein n=1 Tax=Vicia faba TaxID=3906 RepID=A0AAV0YTK1_VICFA|nr:unnamed protein product [Vicia faba]
MVKTPIVETSQRQSFRHKRLHNHHDLLTSATNRTDGPHQNPRSAPRVPEAPRCTHAPSFTTPPRLNQIYARDVARIHDTPTTDASPLPFDHARSKRKPPSMAEALPPHTRLTDGLHHCDDETFGFDFVKSVSTITGSSYFSSFFFCLFRVGSVSYGSSKRRKVERREYKFFSSDKESGVMRET